MPEKAILLQQLNIVRRDKHRLWQIVTCLSFAVILAVFWSLKLTGIGVAGEAFCGRDEHIHSEECVACAIEEHTHTESCYSNIYADIETADDWDRLFGDMAKGPTVKENLVLVAQAQLGYTESAQNFYVDAQVADTVSTDSFITTHMFDYNYLFNVQSANPQVNVSSSSHSETWSMVGSGSVRYENAQTRRLIGIPFRLQGTGFPSPAASVPILIP